MLKIAKKNIKIKDFLLLNLILEILKFKKKFDIISALFHILSYHISEKKLINFFKIVFSSQQKRYPYF